MQFIHSARNSGLFKIVLTIRAPYAGGVEYVARTIKVNWDRTAADVALSFCTTTKLPARSAETIEWNPLR